MNGNRRVMMLAAVVSTMAAVWFCSGLPAAGWPCFQADAARSGVSAGALEFPLEIAWIHRPTQPPRPAWEASSREYNRKDFDYTFHPVAAHGLVFYASSADDTVRALDAGTGELRWRFTAGGPVRFAPHIAGDRVFFAADDGRVYCLDAASGEPVWMFRAALDDRTLIGQNRLISRWPCRSGVLVEDGIVYVTAGMWPSEGVFLYALDAGAGEVIWCNDTIGHTYGNYPHVGDGTLLGGVAPQGYMLAAEDILVVPAGRSSPAAFDRSTGRLLSFAVSGGRGGAMTGVQLVKDRILLTTGKRTPKLLPTVGGREGLLAPQPGEDAPGRILESDEKYHLQVDMLGGDDLMPSGIGTEDPPDLHVPRRAHRDRVFRGHIHRAVYDPQRKFYFGIERGNISAWDVTGRDADPVWSARHPHPLSFSAVLAGDVLIVGGDGTVTAYDAGDGGVLWQRPIDGLALGMAAAEGRLLVTNERGVIYCFSADGASDGAAARRTRETKAPAPHDAVPPRAEPVFGHLQETGTDRGYALVTGEADARLAEALARHTRLHVIAALTDASQVGAERERLLEETDLYGTRLAVHYITDPDSLPFPQFFANLVVVSDASALCARELYRVLRPCGGLMTFSGLSDAEVEALIEAAQAPDSEVRMLRHGTAIVRDKLPGAFDWDSQLEADRRVRWPLELLWFGDPGPRRMAGRGGYHFPITANGRTFVMGRYHIIALDAYNGTELWSHGYYAHGDSVRMLADDDYLYLDFGGYTLQIDAGTGETHRIYGEAAPGPRFRLDRPQRIELATEGGHEGNVELEATADGLTVTLAAGEPEDSHGNYWTLYFSFPPAALQPGLLHRGAFQMFVFRRHGELRWYVRGRELNMAADRREDQRPDYPWNQETAPAWQPGAGPAHPVPRLKSVQTGHGEGVAVEFGWGQIRRLTGRQPDYFLFAAELNAMPVDKQIRSFAVSDRAGLFTDALASAGNGWACFILDGASAPEDNSTLFAAPRGDAGALDLPGSQPAPPWHHPRTAGRSGDELRIDPLTGRSTARTFVRTYGCGGVTSSADMDFMRSGVLGMYDLDDDSGMRNFPGVRPHCGRYHMRATQGLLVSPVASTHCSCAYNYKLSFALAPAGQRRSEDWALFHSEPARGPVRHAHLNFGAPGDRRDSGGALWLGAPRDRWGAGGRAYAVPLKLKENASLTDYRFNSDRTEITGTSSPWIYASGLQGPVRAALSLNSAEGRILSLKTLQPPKLDGEPGDLFREDDPGMLLPEDVGPERLNMIVRGRDEWLPEDKRTAFFIRHDRRNLYLAYRTPARPDRRGRVRWGDEDYLTVYLAGADNSERLSQYIRLEVTPSGEHQAVMHTPDGEETSVHLPGRAVAVKAGEKAFLAETAIPWEALEEAGLNKDSLLIRPDKLPAPAAGFRPENYMLLVFDPAEATAERLFTVRLHFAEYEDVRAGERMFDISLQGETILQNFDIRREAGDIRRAVIKEFQNIAAGEKLTLELIQRPDSQLPPVISGMEIMAE